LVAKAGSVNVKPSVALIQVNRMPAENWAAQ
jgi:hypothetical protein